jgi:hypothetical protein
MMLLQSGSGYRIRQFFVPDTVTLDPRWIGRLAEEEYPYLIWGKHPGKVWIRNQDNGGPYLPKMFFIKAVGNL